MKQSVSGKRMKTEKLVLTTLALAVCVWVIRMTIGVVSMAPHQEVPVLTAVFELGMFLGAGAIPLAAVWLVDRKHRRWLFPFWAPCILYVTFLTTRYILFDPAGGAMRLLLWATIAVLFVRASITSRPTVSAHEAVK